jgi:hypothetical protein
VAGWRREDLTALTFHNLRMPAAKQAETSLSLVLASWRFVGLLLGMVVGALIAELLHRRK